MGISQTKIEPLHPYYPQEVAIPGYVDNVSSVSTLLATFATAETVLLTSTYVVVKRWKPSITLPDLLAVLWFVLCGSLHVFFEGFFILSHRAIPSSQSLLSQLWKEYAFSDSRYLTNDPLILTMEALTVLVWGPLSLLTASSIISRDALRFPLQIIVSVGHLYGCAIYYATSFTEYYLTGASHWRPEAQYFWGYFICMNAPWIVVPAYLIYDGIKQTSKAFAALNNVEEHKKIAQEGKNASSG